MRGFGNRRGVAILIVLGMLSLLMIMAVAFSITMRTERLGAGNYAGQVMSKQLAWAALADAINHIDETMAGGETYPPWDVLCSGVAGSGVATPVALAWGEALGHATGILHAEAVATNAFWMDDVAYSGGAVLGRRAYTIVNVSGLLNGNKVGKEDLERALGFSIDELQLDGAGLQPMFTPPLDPPDEEYGDEFVAQREDEHVRYESVLEMTTLNTGLVDNLYFFTDSLAAQPTNMVYLSSNMNDWVEEDIKQALEDSGIDEDDVDRVYSNLVDYVDEDYVPAGGLEACCGEAVPMVNEVIFSYLLQDGPGGVNMGYVVDVEWYYPFAAKPADDAPSFTMDYTVTFTPKPGTETAFVPDDPASATASLNVNSADQLDTVNFGEMEQGVYVFAPDETVDVGFDVEVDVTIKAGDDVDRVGDPGVDGDGIVFSIDLPGISQGVNVQTQRWAECVDPRFNWETDNVEQWVLDSMLSMLEGVAGDYETEPTPAAENSYAKWLVSHPDHDFVKKNFDAATLRNCASYVANAPIRSVGELGYLCVKPWYTIRLYDHNEPLYDVNPKFHRVFDHLTVHPLAARTSRGLVNINTRHRDVLTTVYYDMPVDEYKEPDDQTRLTWAEAEAISELIITEQPFTNLTDLGTVTTWGDYVSSAREVAKEAPIRNAAGLLTARENLFVIMVAGGPFSRGVGQVAYRGKTGDWLGTQRAVAVVWRDPVPDPDSGKCPVMLRYFKWLED